MSETPQKGQDDERPGSSNKRPGVMNPGITSTRRAEALHQPPQVLPFKGLICFCCHPSVSGGKAPITQRLEVSDRIPGALQGSAPSRWIRLLPTVPWHRLGAAGLGSAGGGCGGESPSPRPWD